ncbi:MAG: formylmethanofuran dehydrogenase [Chloroflexi bacterium]|nr:formylmethanofuran dehydrogenase [Chloroflexota bacterium]
MIDIKDLLEKSAARHTHLCPRQVLGVRVALAGAAALGLSIPCADKRLLIILETDGCFADGVEVAMGCTVGHRTLRVEDYGKIAATFADTATGKSLRVAPRLDIRQRAFAFIPDENRHYFAQLQAYQIMPDDELLSVQEVTLNTPIEQILGKPGVRVTCEMCGEEVINEREVFCNGHSICYVCAHGGYYSPAPEFVTTCLLYPQVME